MTTDPEKAWFKSWLIFGYPIRWQGWTLLVSVLAIEYVLFFARLKFANLSNDNVVLICALIPILIFVFLFRRKMRSS